MQKLWVYSIFFLIVGCSTPSPITETNPPGVSAAHSPPHSTTLPPAPPTALPTVAETTPPSVSKSPTAASPWLILDHKFFVIYYDPSIRLARFVKYSLSASDLRRTHVKRGNKFKADPLLAQKLTPSPSSRLPAMAASKEYEHSGYDQGHLAPSGDFAYDQKANDETFVMSNIAPQKPLLNRQAWRLLEEQVRRWACGEEKITVLTGPILSRKPATLASGLPIPEQFFKIVIDETPPRKTIAFIYNQTDHENVLRERLTSVAEIESRSGQNFALILPSADQTVLRQTSRLADWKSADCVHKKKRKKAA